MSTTECWTAKNVTDFSISAIKEMAIRSAKVDGAASLAWGLPTFRTPDHIRVAAVRALESDPDIGKYSLPDGLEILREAIAASHLAATGISTSPENNIIVSAGNTEGLKVLLQTIINPGDEIVLTDPCFATHIQQISFCQGKPVFWPLDEESGWQLDVEKLSGLLSARTKAIVIVTPSNPTGAIFTEDSLLYIGEIARRHNLLIILDDPYSAFLYEHRTEYFNLAKVPELTENIAYLFSFSKAHAMSGFRLGYIVVPAELKHQILKVHDATLICAPRVSQVAGHAALTSPAPHLEQFESELDIRRSLICARLDRLDAIFDYCRPCGAYYVFPRLVDASVNSREFAIRLLEEARVAVTPGSAFGRSGEGHVRMAFCVSEDTINRAFDRLEGYFGASG